MGTRINYEIMGEEPGDPPSAILYSNSSHHCVDAEEVFRTAVRRTGGPTTLVEALLSARYPSNGGSHREGDRVFRIDTAPGDRDFVLRVRGKTVWREPA